MPLIIKEVQTVSVRGFTLKQKHSPNYKKAYRGQGR
jgi:hypothetical protein